MKGLFRDKITVCRIFVLLICAVMLFGAAGSFSANPKIVQAANPPLSDASLSGALFGPEFGVVGACLDLFTYDSGTGRYKELGTPDAVVTDWNGDYRFDEVPAGEYYLVIGELGNFKPRQDSGLQEVTDEMVRAGLYEGYVTTLPITIGQGSVVKDFSFDWTCPVDISVDVFENCGPDGTVWGQSGFAEEDEGIIYTGFTDESGEEIVYMTEWLTDPRYLGSVTRPLKKKGDVSASFTFGDIGYLVTDVRVLSEQGAANVAISFGKWNGVDASCVASSYREDVIGVYELNASGLPVRQLSYGEYTVNEYEAVCFSDSLMSYGSAYRVILQFRALETFSGAGAVYCVYGPENTGTVNSILGTPYIWDFGRWMSGHFIIHKTDMYRKDIFGAEFVLYKDRECTQPVTVVSGHVNDPAYGNSYWGDPLMDVRYACVSDREHVPGYAYADPSYVYDTLQMYEYDEDSRSIFTAVGLKAGTYYLREVASPNGYDIIGDGIIEIHVNNYDGTFVDNDKEIGVRNRSLYELPATGGIGTVVFLAAGSVLFFMALFLLFARRFFRGRREARHGT